MLTMDKVRNRNDLDVRWPAGWLLDALDFETRVRPTRRIHGAAGSGVTEFGGN